ncbi:hypothetical protein [Haloarcula laminariae]|uniref:hypothetical protein n=1 Tax=Haloarcula laminariae TaxID=2961577 RepID=UPI0021C6268A|nr:MULTISPECIES: hypothetical protein [Halomicroarcula]
MDSAMTCPDCGLQLRVGDDLATGRRVHRLAVRDDGIELTGTVVLRHCVGCDRVVGVS